MSASLSFLVSKMDMITLCRLLTANQKWASLLVLPLPKVCKSKQSKVNVP